MQDGVVVYKTSRKMPSARGTALLGGNSVPASSSEAQDMLAFPEKLQSPGVLPLAELGALTQEEQRNSCIPALEPKDIHKMSWKTHVTRNGRAQCLWHRGNSALASSSKAQEMPAFPGNAGSKHGSAMRRMPGPNSASPSAQPQSRIPLSTAPIPHPPQLSPDPTSPSAQP